MSHDFLFFFGSLSLSLFQGGESNQGRARRAGKGKAEPGKLFIGASHKVSVLICLGLFSALSLSLSRRRNKPENWRKLKHWWNNKSSKNNSSSSNNKRRRPPPRLHPPLRPCPPAIRPIQTTVATVKRVQPPRVTVQLPKQTTCEEQRPSSIRKTTTTAKKGTTRARPRPIRKMN